MCKYLEALHDMIFDEDGKMPEGPTDTPLTRYYKEQNVGSVPDRPEIQPQKG